MQVTSTLSKASKKRSAIGEKKEKEDQKGEREEVMISALLLSQRLIASFL